MELIDSGTFYLIQVLVFLGVKSGLTPSVLCDDAKQKLHTLSRIFLFKKNTSFKQHPFEMEF